MKHTQSEWLYSKYSSGDYGVYSIKGNANDIALVRNYAKEDEVEANAKLIAAAPDLLEALTDLLAWANIKDGSPSQQLRDVCKAAIQKATN